MQAAPITSAASAVLGTAADPNAAGGDLFAALMAALFNPAQMAQAALTPTGDPAASAGGDPLAGQGGAGPQVLPGPGGGTDLVDRPPIPLVSAVGDKPGDVEPDAVEPDGEAGAALRTLPLMGRASMLAPQGREAKLAMMRETAPPTAEAAPASAQPASDVLPPDLMARPEVIALKGQAVAAPSPADTAPASQASLLMAAQAQAPVSQPLAGQPKAKPVVSEPETIKLPDARPLKGVGALTVAQITAQEPASAFAALDGDEPGERPEADAFDAGLEPAALGRRDGQLRADAAQAAAPMIVRGSPHTVAHLSAEIARRLEAQTTRFQVELEPAGLGKVDVRVEIGSDGAVTAALSCDSVHAADILRGRSVELQAALEQAGFDVSGGLSFTAGGAGHGQREQAGRDGRAHDHSTTIAALDEAAPVSAPQPARSGPGRLDIRI